MPSIRSILFLLLLLSFYGCPAPAGFINRCPRAASIPVAPVGNGTWDDTDLDAYNSNLVSVYRFYDSIGAATETVDVINAHNMELSTTDPVNNPMLLGQESQVNYQRWRTNGGLKTADGWASRYARIAHHADFDFSEFTLALWTKDRYAVSQIAEKSGVFSITREESGGYARVSINGTQYFNVAGIFTGLNWECIVIRFSAADGGTLSFFANGTHMTDVTGIGSLVTNTNDIYFINHPGGYGTNGAWYDHVAFWNTAISDDAVDAYYNSGTGRAYKVDSDPDEVAPNSIVVSGADNDPMREIDVNGAYASAGNGYWYFDDITIWENVFVSDAAYTFYGRTIGTDTYYVYFAYSDSTLSTGTWYLAHTADITWGMDYVESDTTLRYPYFPYIGTWTSGCTVAEP